MFLTVHCCFEVHQVSEITVKTSAARDVYIYENKYYTMSTELESFLTIWSGGGGDYLQKIIYGIYFSS